MTLARYAGILALAIGLLGLAPPIWGGEPTDQVLDVLNHPAPKTGPGTAEREAALRQATQFTEDLGLR